MKKHQPSRNTLFYKRSVLTLYVILLLFIKTQLLATTFYSKTNGDWNAVSTWGTSCDSGTGSIPSTDDEVIICNGYSIDITSNVSCSKITVDPSGVLNFNTSDTLNISSSVSIDGTLNLSSGILNASYTFTINGTMKMTSGKLNLITNASNCNLNINGIFNFFGGEVNVAHFTHVQNSGTLNIRGSAQFTAERDVKLRYTKGTINIDGGTAIIKGEINSENVIDEINQTDGVLKFEGANSWVNAGTYLATGGEVIFNGNTKLNYVAPSGSWIFHDITINTNKTLNQFDAANIHVNGGWTNNGVFTPKSRIVTLSGDNVQEVSGTSPTTFYSLTIDNNSSTGITLLQPVIVSSMLTLTDGFVYTDATNLIIVVNNASATTGSSESFVIGPFKKIGNDPFIFPVGAVSETNIWARLEMVDNANFKFYNATTEFTCTYFNTGAPNNNSEYMSGTIDHVSYVEYWDLERTYDVANNAQCNVKVFWEDSLYSGITDTSNLLLTHYNSDFAYYEDLQGIVSGSSSGSIVSSSPLTNFSPFTFGSKLGGGVNPLPIELLAFNANLKNEAVKLTWVTASETNNDFFTIEKTTDGANFETLITIKGAGNSTSFINYIATDWFPQKGVSYYRLKQTDFDGNSTYSDLKMVSIKNLENPEFGFYLLAEDRTKLNIKIISPDNKNLLLTIHTTLGKAIYTQRITSKDYSSTFISIDYPQELTPGVYIISISSKQATVSKKYILM